MSLSYLHCGEHTHEAAPTRMCPSTTRLLLWLSIPCGFLVLLFEKPNRSSFTFTFTPAPTSGLTPRAPAAPPAAAAAAPGRGHRHRLQALQHLLGDRHGEVCVTGPRRGGVHRAPLRQRAPSQVHGPQGRCASGAPASVPEGVPPVLGKGLGEGGKRTRALFGPLKCY
jgi:hypothetical protein